MSRRSKKSSKGLTPAEQYVADQQYYTEYQQQLSYGQAGTYTHENELNSDGVQVIDGPELDTTQHTQEDDEALEPAILQMEALSTLSEPFVDRDKGGYSQQPPNRILVQTLDPNTSTEPSDKRMLQSPKKRGFRVGNVFQLLWTTLLLDSQSGEDEAAQADIEMSLGTEEVVRDKYNRESHVIVRQFVIVSERTGCCVCLPITTYSGQATNKAGVHPAEHAIIYDKKPKPLEGERLIKRPIEFLPSSPEYKLSSASRINYGRVYVVEHDVKVLSIGKIDQKSRKILQADYRLVNPRPQPPSPEKRDTQYSADTSRKSSYTHGYLSYSSPLYSTSIGTQDISNDGNDRSLSKRSYTHSPYIPQGSAHYYYLTDQDGRQVRQYGVKDRSAEDVATTEFK